MANYPVLAQRARVVAAICYGGLLLLLAWVTLIAPSHGREPNPVVWLLVSLPLLMFARGVWKGDPRSHGVLCFVSLIYFIPTVVFLSGRAALLIDSLQLLLLIGLFISAMLFARWRSRALAAAASEEV